jgi:galactose mutarotase-like enzyme
MMYLNLLKRWFSGLWDRLFPKGFRRSPALPIAIVVLFIVLPLVAWKLHRLGRFGALKREIKGQSEAPVEAGPRPGGVDPIILKRDQTPGSNLPEFRSATLLPGLGMQVLQITATLPNRGEIELLDGPSLKAMADGTTPTRVGPNDRWGAIEAPWSGLLTGLLAPLGTSIRTSWRGHAIEGPNDVPGRTVAEGGMLDSVAADQVTAKPETNPTTATATFKGVDFDQHWVARNDFTVTVTMSATTIDLTVTAKNVSDNAEPMGLGWHPRFIIPSGNRTAAELRLPNGEELEIGDRVKGTPSGKIQATPPAVSRFQSHPTGLGTESFDEALVHLKAGVLDIGTSVEMRDPESELGVRLTAVSNSIRELRVTSPMDAKYVGMGMQTNFDDPLGKEWPAGGDASIPVLLPGETAEYKVRLEIFPITNHNASR